jgi:uncharacterized protein
MLPERRSRRCLRTSQVRSIRRFSLRTHADEIRAAARRRKIRNIRVFGSTARGDESSTSDVDLLVDFDAAKHCVLPLAGFAADVRAIIGRDVDVTTADLLRDDVRRSALAEAVPL